MTRLEVSYDANLYFTSKGLDAEIEKTVGKSSCGSGMGMGYRDIGFEFRTKQAALNAKKKISNLAKKKKLSKQVKSYIYDDE